MSIEIQKHIAYHKLCLNLLPAPFAAMDLNRLSLGFFLLNSLDILGELRTITPEDREHWIDWIYKCQVPTGGFRGSTATKTSDHSVYDAAHLPATYFAIALLSILEDDLKRVNREGALTTLRQLQNGDGSFSPVLIGNERFGEVDARHLYCAVAVRDMLSPIKADEDINVAAAVSYLQQCKVSWIQFTYNRVMMGDMLRVRSWNLMVLSF
jgi:geranylgeranyl transferase type-1 subunit beta